MDKQTIFDRLDLKAFYSSELPSLKVNGSGMGQALCPFHSDTKPSFSVDLKTGGFRCFGCDAKGSTFDFVMKKNGLDFSGAKALLAKEAGLLHEPKRKIAATYDYTDESGNHLFQVVRYEPKAFSQRRPDGKGGWIWNLEGVRLVPYNLPEVIKSDSVFIVEGEKDVETLRGIGLVASCNPMGAGKWRPEYNEHFKGKRVAIIPDIDGPAKNYAGEKHAQSIARYLKGIALSTKVIELPGLPEKRKDITDWIQAGGTREELLEIVKGTPEWERSESPHIGDRLSDYSELEPSSFLKRGSDLRLMDISISWAIDKLLPKESITLLHGRGGIGKTWLSLIMADAINKGASFMELDTQRMQVVFIDFENSLPVLIERIRKIGIEEVLFWHSANEILKPPKLDRNEWELYKKLPSGSLLVFDTLRASQGQDENDSRHMAFIMARLKELRDMGFTILLLHHTPKGNDRTYKGSTAILDLADHVLSLHKVRRNNPEGGEVDDDEDHDCLYRLGTKDKTRYEPFHIFMTFDKEKGFVEAVDPDEEEIQGICPLLEGKRLNTNQFCELIKEELDIRGKEHALKLIRKGTGKYWTAEKEGRAVYYSSVLKSPLYIPDYKTDNLNRSENDETELFSERSQSLANPIESYSPGIPQTDETDSVIDLTGDDVEVVG